MKTNVAGIVVLSLLASPAIVAATDFSGGITARTTITAPGQGSTIVSFTPHGQVVGKVTFNGQAITIAFFNGPARGGTILAAGLPSSSDDWDRFAYTAYHRGRPLPGTAMDFGADQYLVGLCQAAGGSATQCVYWALFLH